jgi:hypothetical protein
VSKRSLKTYSIPRDTLAGRKNDFPSLLECKQCGVPARMIIPEKASGIVNVSTRTIYSWLAERKIHFTSTQGGTVLICLNSLPRDSKRGDEKPLTAEKAY